jgi:hypothetical protein
MRLDPEATHGHKGGTNMKSLSVAIVCAALAVTGQAVASDTKIIVKTDAAEVFAKLPEGVRFPEGITANPANGDIFVGTFNPITGINHLLRFNRKGQLKARKDFPGQPLLGLAFRSSNVYIANVGNLAGTNTEATIQRIAANFTDTINNSVTTVATIPRIGAPDPRTVVNPDTSTDTITFGNFQPAPNALEFAANGLLVSDSFQGAIFRVPNSCLVTPPCAAS